MLSFSLWTFKRTSFTGQLQATARWVCSHLKDKMCFVSLVAFEFINLAKISADWARWSWRDQPYHHSEWPVPPLGCGCLWQLSVLYRPGLWGHRACRQVDRSQQGSAARQRVRPQSPQSAPQGEWVQSVSIFFCCWPVFKFPHGFSYTVMSAKPSLCRHSQWLHQQRGRLRAALPASATGLVQLRVCHRVQAERRQQDVRPLPILRCHLHSVCHQGLQPGGLGPLWGHGACGWQRLAILYSSVLHHFIFQTLPALASFFY